MSLTIEVKRTGDLTLEDRTGLCQLFESVFHKPCPEDLFLRKYARAWPGYSHHALARGDGAIVGAYSAIPVRYSFFGQELPFAIPADLMVDSRFRGNMRAVHGLSNALYTALADAGTAFVFGSLREEMAVFHQRMGGWRTIGPMPYYVAPLRGPHIPGAGLLLRPVVRMANLWRTTPPFRTPDIHKVDDRAFREYRYKIFPSEYRTIQAGASEGIYTGRLFYEIPGVPRGIRLSLLVDVNPPGPREFDEIVHAIQRAEPQIDYLAYQGWLPFHPKRMLRVPHRWEKPHWFACGRILHPDLVDERVFDIRNWSINLSNGDIV